MSRVGAPTGPMLRGLPNLPYICEMLKAARVQRGWSQRDLAAKIGVAQSIVSHWENGQVRPKMEHLLKWAEVLDQDISRLLQ